MSHLDDMHSRAENEPDPKKRAALFESYENARIAAVARGEERAGQEEEKEKAKEEAKKQKEWQKKIVGRSGGVR